MTQGIFSSLNITLARLNSIESNFRALEGLSNKINSSGILNAVQTAGNNAVNSVENKDFKTILDEKLSQNKDIEKAEKIIEESTEDELSPLQKAALNLKSKINLN